MKNFKVLKLTAITVVMSVVFSSNCPPTDPLDHTVLLPNPDDCRSFYMCSNGVPILQICPEGLHFNAHLDCCDWPEKAGCAKCDIQTYNINTREQYVTTTVQYNAEFGFHAKVGLRTVKLGFGATVGGTVGIPDCTVSDGNCCLKSFIEKKPKYY